MSSLLKSSSDTLTANVVGQTIGIISFLLLPNIFSVDDYAVTVFVGILLYYSGFMDFGMLQVYGRKAPGMIAQGQEYDVINMEDSIQYFWHMTTFIYSVIAGLIFYLKYYSLADAALLIIYINIAPFVLLFLQKKTVRVGFSAYKKISIISAISKLLFILGAYLLNVSGWLMGMIANILCVFVYSRDKTVCRINFKANPFSYIRFIPEGIVLSLIMMIWGTMLMLGRLSAVFVCPENVVSQYGIINGGYSMTTSALIAIHLPVTIKIYAMCAGKRSDLFDFFFKLQVITVPAITVCALILADFSPLVLEIFFKKYQFDPLMIMFMMMSITALPFLVSVGSVLIGNKIAKSYLVAFSIILGASFLFLYGTAHIFSDLTPAIAQFIFLNTSAITLMSVMWFYFAKHTIRSYLLINFPFILVIFLISINYGIKELCGILINGEYYTAIIADGLISTMFGIIFLYFYYFKHKSKIVEKIKALYLESIIPEPVVIRE
jgi:hypothetical protein